MRRVPRVARSAAALALAVGVVSDCAEAQGIDAFVAEARARQGLAASAPADPITWLRRVSLDLTGLPPTPSAARAFAADERDGARERAVDALLASPAYGERWAVWWLDLARYADSQGYEKDGLRPTILRRPLRSGWK